MWPIGLTTTGGQGATEAVGGGGSGAGPETEVGTKTKGRERGGGGGGGRGRLTTGKGAVDKSETGMESNK